MNLRYIIAIVLMAAPNGALGMESMPLESAPAVFGPNEALMPSDSFSGTEVHVQNWRRLKAKQGNNQQLFSMSDSVSSGINWRAFLANMGARATSFFKKSSDVYTNESSENIDIREVHAAVHTLDTAIAAWQERVNQLAPHLEITPKNKRALTKLVLNGALILEVVDLEIIQPQKRIHTEVMNEHVKAVVNGMSMLKRSLENQEKSFALFETKNAHGMPLQAYNYSIDALYSSLKGLFRDPESYKNDLTVIIETLQETVEDADHLMKIE